MKKIIAIVVMLLLIVGAVIVVKKKKGSIANTPTMAPYPLAVETAEVKDGNISISSHYLGTIMPLNYADVAPRITGNILSVNVREGDRVHKGQLLVHIDDSALKEKESAQSLEISSAESQLAGARSVYETQQAIYERDEMLYKEKAISLEALQRSKAQRDSTYAQVKSIEEKIKALNNVYNAAKVETSYARLHSPIDGVITKRLQESGDLAIPGKPVLRVEGTSNFKVMVQIPGAEMPLMKKGGQVILSDGKSRLEAAITKVYPAVTLGTLGTIEIDTPKQPFNIISGGAVSVDVITGKTDKGMVIPLNALLETQSGNFVFKAETTTGQVSGPSIVKVVPVQVFGKNSENACVKGDIKNGDRVITGDEGKLLRISAGMTVVPSKSSGSSK